MQKDLFKGLAMAVIMAILGASIQTYLDVRDMKRIEGEQKAKLDWLYHYTFPNMGP